jgi:translation initiation factor 2 gamma subunit (eIF-2gamma)
MSEQLEEISDNLRSSLGYGAAKIFQCSECGSGGTVAIHVKCTSCGEENWMGWWPEEDDE